MRSLHPKQGSRIEHEITSTLCSVFWAAAGIAVDWLPPSVRPAMLARASSYRAEREGFLPNDDTGLLRLMYHHLGVYISGHSAFVPLL